MKMFSQLSTFFFLMSVQSFSSMVTRRFVSMKSYLGKAPVFVAGAGSGVGFEVCKQLSALGTPVQALVRTADAKKLLESLKGVTAFVGDASQAANVQKAMQSCVAAVTTLGGKTGDIRIDYIGNSNVIEQAGILGCERIILVTSIGCGDSKVAITPSVYSVLEEAILAKDKAERDLRMYTNLDWTIIRPGGLKSDIGTGKAVLTEDFTKSGLINRADVAQLIVKALGSDGKCTRKTLSAIDPSMDNGTLLLGNDRIVPYVF